jgi:hypothetical protein
MRYIICLLLYCNLASATNVIFVYTVNRAKPDSNVSSASVVELFDGGALQVGLSDLGDDTTSNPQLVSDLLIRKLAQRPEQVVNSSTEVQSPQPAAENQIWNSGLFGGVWQLCFMCPEMIRSHAPAASPSNGQTASAGSSSNTNNAGPPVSVNAPSNVETANSTVSSSMPTATVSMASRANTSPTLGSPSVLDNAPASGGGGVSANAAVPEPGAWTLAAAGFTLLGLARRRLGLTR